MAFFSMPGGTEWIVIAVFALLLFGRRLPDVARSLGRSIVEFKKGIREVKDDVENQSSADRAPSPRLGSTSSAALPTEEQSRRESVQTTSPRSDSSSSTSSN